ncbi:hypothetical protein ACSLVK_10485 [Photorhabdus tasmaniensis]|uniref:hypothetical protein n=1 Tax=Photorhabdus tasmaniensis TaxID=1004159 RepID=UPI0040421D8A
MAKITNIKDVINNASRKIYIIAGESNNKTHTVNSNSEWVGDILVFQDYLNPPNKDQVKSHKGKDKEGKQVVKFNII